MESQDHLYGCNGGFYDIDTITNIVSKPGVYGIIGESCSGKTTLIRNSLFKALNPSENFQSTFVVTHTGEEANYRVFGEKVYSQKHLPGIIHHINQNRKDNKKSLLIIDRVTLKKSDVDFIVSCRHQFATVIIVMGSMNDHSMQLTSSISTWFIARQSPSGSRRCLEHLTGGLNKATIGSLLIFLDTYQFFITTPLRRYCGKCSQHTPLSYIIFSSKVVNNQDCEVPDNSVMFQKIEELTVKMTNTSLIKRISQVMDEMADIRNSLKMMRGESVEDDEKAESD